MRRKLTRNRQSYREYRREKRRRACTRARGNLMNAFSLLPYHNKIIARRKKNVNNFARSFAVLSDCEVKYLRTDLHGNAPICTHNILKYYR